VTSRILLTGGCVLTLGAKTPNFREADVLIDGEAIADVGPGLRARDAEQVDATNTIVMPGFVDTHRHTWTSLFRNLGDGGGGGELAATAEHFAPDDVYAATLIGLLGAAEAGITTVVDRTLEGAADGSVEAALQAHVDAGLRTVLVPGSDLSLLARLRDAAGPSTRVAFASSIGAGAPSEGLAGAWAAARELGLRIHALADPTTAGAGTIAGVGQLGLLGDDVTLVHPSGLDDTDADAIAASGASIAIAPSGEIARGFGAPQIQRLIDRDIRPGLAIDDERVTPGDMFAQMRATISLQHATVFDRKLAGKAGVPRLMSTRDVIRFATVDGARASGWDGVTGSLAPGMRADVIVLRADRPNIFPVNDPIGAVVWGMDTSNVDRVYVDGRIVMRGGVLAADVERARMLAATARQRVAAAAGLVVGAAAGASG
jgi:5-methylthioadenosine/S-adenosylhomocysteine deaminase